MTQEDAGSSPARCASPPPKLRCNCGSNILYGLVRDGKVRRLTFSEDLARFIQGKNPDHEIWKLDLVIGPPATASSRNCLFGIVSARNHRLLRGAITFEEADFLCQDPSRYPAECWVRSKELYLPQEVP